MADWQHLCAWPTGPGIAIFVVHCKLMIVSSALPTQHCNLGHMGYSGCKCRPGQFGLHSANLPDKFPASHHHQCSQITIRQPLHDLTPCSSYPLLPARFRCFWKQASSHPLQCPFPFLQPQPSGRPANAWAKRRLQRTIAHQHRRVAAVANRLEMLGIRETCRASMSLSMLLMYGVGMRCVIHRQLQPNK